VTTCFGLYHQAIIRSQVNNRILRKVDTVIHKNESHRLKMQRDLVVVILYGSICDQCKVVKKRKIVNIVKLSVLRTILSLFIYRWWVYGGV